MQKKMPSTSQSNRLPLPLIRLVRVWRTPLVRHIDDFAQRYLAYILSAIIIGVLTYIAMHYLGISQFPGYYKFNVLYHHRYAMETAINFGLWLYLAEEWGSRFMGPWALKQHRTVGATCLLWSGGFLVALVLQFTLIYDRIDLYAPKIIHFFDLYPLRRPSVLVRLTVFGAIWLIVLNSRLILGVLLQQVTNLNRQAAHGRNGVKTHAGVPQHGAPSKPETNPGGTPERKPLYIPTGKAVSAIQTDTLACITSEGHYCRFILKSNGRRNEIFTRAALKDILTELPPEDFIQIHRSHVVNKHYVDRLKRSGRSYALYLNGTETPLPISRYRWPSIRDRLDLSLNPERFNASNPAQLMLETS